MQRVYLRLPFGPQVAQYELTPPTTGISLIAALHEKTAPSSKIRVFKADDFCTDRGRIVGTGAMLILPCSMGTLGCGDEQQFNRAR